jgi:hypothetical protein
MDFKVLIAESAIRDMKEIIESRERTHDSVGFLRAALFDIGRREPICR